MQENRYTAQDELSPNYVGRFAPSPTGPLHMGSLVTALASYLDAKHNKGQWLVRMEDLDPPREMAGASGAILKSLEEHGLHWDQSVKFQSQRSDYYEQVLTQLNAKDLLFPCLCTRAQLQGTNKLHQGICDSDPDALKNQPHALRLKVDNQTRCFTDQLFGEQQQNLLLDVGDITLKRKDGLFAYQLAVVVDDATQGVTHIVRGADLLDSTLRQIYLQKCLGYSTPHYCHLPLLKYPCGQKLSKQNQAPAIDDKHAFENLKQALAYLHQPTPDPSISNIETLLDWACRHWQSDKLHTTDIVLARSD